MPRAIAHSLYYRAPRKIRSESRARASRTGSATSTDRSRRFAAISHKTPAPDARDAANDAEKPPAPQNEDDKRNLELVYVDRDQQPLQFYHRPLLRILSPPTPASTYRGTQNGPMPRSPPSSALSPSASSTVVDTPLESDSTPNAVTPHQRSQRLDISTPTSTATIQASPSSTPPNETASVFFLQRRSSLHLLLLPADTMTNIIHRSIQDTSTPSLPPKTTSATPSAIPTPEALISPSRIVPETPHPSRRANPSLLAPTYQPPSKNDGEDTHPPSVERRSKRPRHVPHPKSSTRATHSSSTDDVEGEYSLEGLEIVPLLEVGWSEEDDWCSCGEEDLGEDGVVEEGWDGLDDGGEGGFGGEWEGERREFWGVG